jgi:cytochrome c oxidase subunit 1
MASDAIPLTVHNSSLSVVYEWLATVDHKKIGIMYIVYALLFLVVMGIEAILMRLQ